MKGLLLKDFYMAKKYCRSYTLITVAFIAISFASSDDLFFVFYPCMLSGMIPVMLLGYDERSKWNEYCGTLPYTKAQIVSGKYFIGLFAHMLVWVLSGIAQAVKMNINGNFVWNDYLVIMSTLLILSCFTSSLSLPFMFKFGVDKGQIAYYVTIGILLSVLFVASSIFDEKLQTEVSFDGVLPILCIVGIAGYLLSWHLSIVFFKKREI